MIIDCSNSYYIDDIRRAKELQNSQQGVQYFVDSYRSQNTPMLKRMRDDDPTIPAGLICQDNAYVLADEDAYGENMMLKRINKKRRSRDTWIATDHGGSAF